MLYNYPETKCIILNQVLYFQEVVIILHTLFENKKHPIEMSFAYYFTKSENKDLKKEINKIRKEYFISYLDKFRNKLIAHKQADSAGDPFTGFLNPVKRIYVENSYSIVKKLRKLVIDNFDCAVNNYFKDYYNPGFEVLYKVCESALDK